MENKESEKSDEATGVNYRKKPDQQENRPHRYFQQIEYGQRYNQQCQLQRDDTRDCNFDIQCHRCGQYGHMSYGSRVRLDHRRSLNSSRRHQGADVRSSAETPPKQ